MLFRDVKTWGEEGVTVESIRELVPESGKHGGLLCGPCEQGHAGGNHSGQADGGVCPRKETGPRAG